MQAMTAQPASEPDAAPGGDRSLDLEDWEAFRALCHDTLDRLVDHLATVRERPVWTPVPEPVKEALATLPPVEGEGAARARDDALRLALAHGTGNTHSRFFGWVHGAGTAGGVLAEMTAATINANLGGRDHGAIYVERHVIDWCRRIFDFPETASGLLVSGTSMATLIGLAVARHAKAGYEIREHGVDPARASLVAYASAKAHGSVAKALELLGLGRRAPRAIPVDVAFRMDLAALRECITYDREAGLRPFCVVVTVGTVNTGAINDLDAIAELCTAEGLWLHVDGAFGALAALSETLRPWLAGIERADSLAFDFHKWMHVPYDAGCVLVRDGALHRAAFAGRPAYLAANARGLAGASPGSATSAPSFRVAFAPSRSGSPSRSMASDVWARGFWRTAARRVISRVWFAPSRGSN